MVEYNGNNTIIAFFMVFGRTDLRNGVSAAKFDGQADFDVKKCLAPPKSAENHEKPKKNRKKKFFGFFFDLESFEMRFGNVLQVKNCEKTAKNGENYEFVWSNTNFYSRIRIFWSQFR